MSDAAPDEVRPTRPMGPAAPSGQAGEAAPPTADPFATRDPLATHDPQNPSFTFPLPVGEPERGVLPAIPGYEMEGVLGRGGMGVVYKARHLALKRTVAMKMILAGGHAGRGERARFRAEAEAVARLGHPNIVQIHEVGEHDGLPYYAMEFVAGGSLSQKL